MKDLSFTVIGLCVLVVTFASSCQNSEEHQHGTYENWIHQNHEHYLNDSNIVAN